MEFAPADDDRLRRTVDTIERELAEGGLVRRWTNAKDGAFFICSFWLASALARADEIERHAPHSMRRSLTQTTSVCFPRSSISSGWSLIPCSASSRASVRARLRTAALAQS